MTTDDRSGRRLEGLVAFVESSLAGPLFSVTTNERLFNANGKQVAEFDVVVRGKVGSGNIAWLIECRDRKEKAGVDWIQQLPTRRNDHNFDKVTAVSTSGFTEAAIECANRNNIELRTITDVPPADLLTWLRVPSAVFSSKTTACHGVTIKLHEPTPELEDAAGSVLKQISEGGAVFKHNEQLMTCDRLFLACVRQHGLLFDDMAPNGPDKRIELNTVFDPPTAIKLVTPIGDASIASATFLGELRYQESDGSLAEARTYADAKDDRRISESTVFTGPEMGGNDTVIEAHTFAESGVTQFVVKMSPKKA